MKKAMLAAIAALHMTGRTGSISCFRTHNATSQVESFSVSIFAAAEEVQGYFSYC